MSADVRDSGLHHYSTIRADVQDLVDAAVGGQAIAVVCASGRTYYARAGYETAVTVVCEGPGGGYCWTRQWPRSDLTRHLRSLVKNDPEVRRGPVDEVIPEGYR